jgi:hypothetical protein
LGFGHEVTLFDAVGAQRAATPHQTTSIKNPLKSGFFIGIFMAYRLIFKR